MEMAGMLGLLSDSSGPAWWIYPILLVLAMLALLLPRRLAKKSQRASSTTESPRETVELRRSVEELLVELQKFSQEVNASMDTRMMALERLIADADQRIAEAGKLNQSVVQVVESRPAAGEQPALTPEEVERRKLEARVVELAGESRSTLEIAQLTGMPRGEVELVLALRRNAMVDGGGK